MTSVMGSFRVQEDISIIIRLKKGGYYGTY